MAEERVRPIVIKKIKKGGHGHHGGAWKIAYADFVTAMMAFFLLMWLLGSTAKGDLKGIEDYFKTPLKVAMLGGSGSGDATSIIKGGGKDLSRKDGQVKKTDAEEGKKTVTVDAEDVKKALAKLEAEKLLELKAALEKTIEESPTLIKFKKQIILDITTEGLRIQIVDEQNRPMFESAKAEMQPYAKQVLKEIGKMLNGVTNRVSLSGHTDVVPYSTGEKSYSNWELSADRANASRRELIAGGMDETKVLRVVGLSSVSLFDKEDPTNPINRRISIIVMNKQAEENALKDSAAVSVATDATKQDIDKAVLEP
jgi:chemotaxis protein MotB